MDFYLDGPRESLAWVLVTPGQAIVPPNVVFHHSTDVDDWSTAKRWSQEMKTATVCV